MWYLICYREFDRPLVAHETQVSETTACVIAKNHPDDIVMQVTAEELGL